MGVGSFGSVFKIKHMSTQQIRVVKEIKKKKLSNEKQLKNEINALMRLNHPNLVKLYDIFED